MTEGQFNEMEFSEIVFQSKMIDDHKAEEFKNGLVFAAFVGYQNMMFSGGKKISFSKYLNDLGLSDEDKKITPEDRKRVAEAAYATGERVMKMFKGKLK